MGQNKVNERIAMAMLRQCALVWEYCTMLAKPATEFECRFADIYKGIHSTISQCNSTPGLIILDIAWCQYSDIFAQKMREVEGTMDYIPDGRQTTVKMFFSTSDTDPQAGLTISYPVEMVFEVCHNFCRINGCPGLLNKAVFGMDGSGKWAHLPQVSSTRKNTKKTTARMKSLKTVVKSEPTLADRLREALLRQLKQVA